ncbi:MAG: hypothetical protein R2810_03995 [Flavobacteriales bacterium]
MTNATTASAPWTRSRAPSPLYQEFSKGALQAGSWPSSLNEDRKRELLKEFLHKYVEYDIINLSDESFDDFTTFAVSVPDPAIKASSQQHEFPRSTSRRSTSCTPASAPPEALGHVEMLGCGNVEMKCQVRS